MGLYGGGGGSPPPPPDYTAQKNAAKASYLADAQTQADAWNSAVSEYDTAMTDTRNVYSDVDNLVQGATVTSLWDDPTTTDVNENISTRQNDSGQTYGQWLDTTIGNIDQYSGGLGIDKPLFDNVLQTEWGPVTISESELPTLSSYDTSGLQGFRDNLSGTRSTLTGLVSDRRDAEAGIKQQIYDGFKTLNDMGFSVGGMDITSNTGDLERQLNTLQFQLNNPQSEIANQLMTGEDRERAQNEINNILNTINNLKTARAAEGSRVSAFGNQLYSDIDAQSNILGGLNITNLEEMQSIQNRINEINRSKNSFSSVLGPGSWGGQEAELQALQTRLNQLMQERTSEEGRIDDFRTDYRSGLQDIYNVAGETGIYSKSGLDALQDQLDYANYEADNFSSLLPFDEFTGGFYGPRATSRLQGLYDERGERLDDILADIQGSTTGLGDVPLWDEQAINAYRGRVDQAGDRLSPFSGGRVSDISEEIRVRSNEIDNKIGELTAYRQKLEDDAKVLLQSVRDGSYYSVGDLTGDQDSAGDMKAEIDLYKSQQAMDEITAILDRLNSEKQRLERDAQNVMARQNTAQGNLVIGQQGVPTFGQQSLITPFGVQAYNYNPVDEEEDGYLSSSSPFSSSLANAITIA